MYVRRWKVGVPIEKGVLFIAHGMGETADYYDEFAETATEKGYSVVVPEMRGHGRTAGDVGSPDYRLTGGNPGPDSLHGMARDLSAFLSAQLRRAPEEPVFLLGHSMGSAVAQLTAGAQGERLAGLILTGLPSSRQIPVLLPVVEDEIRRSGPQAPSRDTFNAMFGHSNDAFAPAETPLAWITGDREMAMQSFAMPYTNVLFTNEFYRDLLLAVQETDIPAAWAAVPRRLPVFLLSGACDIVGEKGKALLQKKKMLQSLGFTGVEYKIFPGLRHSILRETRRREVAKTITDWMTGQISGFG